MGPIRRPLYSGTGGTEATTLIQFINVRETQIHKWCCLGLDRIIRKVYPTTRSEVAAGTVGEVETNHLAENGRRI